MTEVAIAHELILSHIPEVASELASLRECYGRTLRQPVAAERDQPPFDRVTMDGIAIAYADWRRGAREFRIAGVQAAGAPVLAAARAGECIEVMTGAMLPAGTDTIVPVERIERGDGTARITAESIATGQFVHPRGSDRRVGDVLVHAGTRVGPPEAAVLASSGRGSFAVARLPRAAVISTGDELVDAADPIAPHQIRSTNDYALEAALTLNHLAVVTRARLKDDAGMLAEAIARLHDEHDLLILSGGVSMGKFDFVPAVLERLGATAVFHRIEQVPGRPMWFGVSQAGKPIFALPGNPVSTLICATRYVLPMLRRAAGLADVPIEHVRLAAEARVSSTLTTFLPVTLRWSDDGAAFALPRPTNTSGDFAALAGTDGFVELPAAYAPHPAGTPAPLYRWL